jgi:osmotically-inducible protein OsmY
LRFISCEFSEGAITLQGRVPNYYLKQVAQTLVRQIDGVLVVNNRLDVAQPLVRQ